jgi:hypothetical protein
MAIDAAHRSSIYQSLVPVLGEEDANILMSEFPATEADELVTKGFLRGEIADLRTELRSEIANVRIEMGELRTELRTEIGTQGKALRGEIGGLRTELERLRGETNTKFAEQATAFEAALARQTRWVMAAVISGLVASTAIGAGFG